MGCRIQGKGQVRGYLPADKGWIGNESWGEGKRKVQSSCCQDNVQKYVIIVPQRSSSKSEG